MYALHNFNWKPSEFLNLPYREKAAVIAMINERAEKEAKLKKSTGL